MEYDFLMNGIVVAQSIKRMTSQDFIEIQLENGKRIIITASAGGHLKVGINPDAIAVGPPERKNVIAVDTIATRNKSCAIQSFGTGGVKKA